MLVWVSYIDRSRITRYSVTRIADIQVFIMDKTAGQRQQKFREQIAKGDKKRLQLVIDRDDAEQLDKICSAQGISKTDFLRRAISQYGNTCDI